MWNRSLLALMLAIASPTAFAADIKDQAERLTRDNPAAVTVFIDATLGARKDHAATQLSKAHAAFATRGYQVIDVETYTENGDLQGFFVTYRRDGSPIP